ncbi:unnamed protein product, partial [Gulo gulo]
VETPWKLRRSPASGPVSSAAQFKDCTSSGPCCVSRLQYCISLT